MKKKLLRSKLLEKIQNLEIEKARVSVTPDDVIAKMYCSEAIRCYTSVLKWLDNPEGKIV